MSWDGTQIETWNLHVCHVCPGHIARGACLQWFQNTCILTFPHRKPRVPFPAAVNVWTRECFLCVCLFGEVQPMVRTSQNILTPQPELLEYSLSDSLWGLFWCFCSRSWLGCTNASYTLCFLSEWIAVMPTPCVSLSDLHCRYPQTRGLLGQICLQPHDRNTLVYRDRPWEFVERKDGRNRKTWRC